MWTATIIAIAAIVAIWSDALPWLRGPAPRTPREWHWVFQPRHTMDRIGWACAAGAALIGLLLASGSAWATRHQSRARTSILIAATIVGTLFQVAVLHLEPNGAAATWMERTYTPEFTSFFSVAVETNHLEEHVILSQYDTILQQAGRLAFHAATHPPAGVLLYRSLIRTFRREPRVTDVCESALKTFGVDAVALEPLDAPASARSLPYAVAAIAAGLFLTFAGVLTCVPLAYAAESLGASPLAASRIGILWCLCPALINFSPYVDQALALPLTAAAALLLIAANRSDRPMAMAVAAGVAAAAAALVSYGALAMLGVVALIVLAAGASRPARTAGILAIAGITTIALLEFLRAVGFNYLTSAEAALTWHRVQFTMGRTYSLWLGFNLIDFAVFAGTPVIVYALLTTVAGMTERHWWSDKGTRVAAALFASMLLLDASGTVRGEVGRIWLPLMPMFYLVLIGGRRRRDQNTGTVNPTIGNSVVLATALMALTVALRVSWGP